MVVALGLEAFGVQGFKSLRLRAGTPEASNFSDEKLAKLI